MELIEEKKEHALIIGIKGRLDTTTYGILEKRLTEHFDNGEMRIVVDCLNMDYVSSSGLRVLLIGLKKARLHGGRFVISSLRDNIREIFEISGFSSIFEIFSSRDEALLTISKTN
jgi:anti-anti-sigma factor